MFAAERPPAGKKMRFVAKRTPLAKKTSVTRKTRSVAKRTLAAKKTSAARKSHAARNADCLRMNGSRHSGAGRSCEPGGEPKFG
jgi:hypothetical protein